MTEIVEIKTDDLEPVVERWVVHLPFVRTPAGYVPNSVFDTREHAEKIARIIGCGATVHRRLIITFPAEDGFKALLAEARRVADEAAAFIKQVESRP
jgi:hypothetical protein